MFNFWKDSVCSFFILVLCSFCFLNSEAQKKHDQDLKIFLDDSSLQFAHVGISVFDETANKPLINYQGEKYFVPASNTKLFSLYAGLKYLGDSLIGIRYIERDTDILILPSGDPTLLHPDYSRQPVIDFLKWKKRNMYIVGSNWKETAWGDGWSWNDYNDDYMAERSPMPVYGNLIRWIQTQQADSSFSTYSIPEINWQVNFNSDSGRKTFLVKRNLAENIFNITEGKEKYSEQDVPYFTNGLGSGVELLKDTIGKNIFINNAPLKVPISEFKIIHSQPADSIFRPMMFQSDNFFAEQTLLMASNERLGYMNDRDFIDTLLSTDLKAIPQKPVWVDGSGLSRYNLFSPNDFIFILRKMKDDFGLDKMKRILPTGGQGTLGNRYKQDMGFIFAKTGSMSGVVCFSGYLISKKNHLLLFSILVNNNKGGSPYIRNATEKFLDALRSKY